MYIWRCGELRKVLRIGWNVEKLGKTVSSWSWVGNPPQPHIYQALATMKKSRKWQEFTKIENRKGKRELARRAYQESVKKREESVYRMGWLRKVD